MHERIRAADEDFAEIGLAIIKFGAPDEDRRAVRLHTDDGVTPLYARRITANGRGNLCNVA